MKFSMSRLVVIILIILLLPTIACHENPGQRAEATAREHMVKTIGAPAVQRAHIQTRASSNGWVVLFHHANASCSEGSFWPGACRFSSDEVHKHLYACVDRDLKIGFIGSRNEQVTLWQENLCQTQSLEPPTMGHSTTAPKL